MFRKIIVAMDRSTIGKKVFDEVLALAKVTGANLMLLHALSDDEPGNPPLPSPYTFEYYPGLYEENLEQWKTLEKQGLEMLQSRAEEATTAGVKTEFTQTYGSPGRTICELTSGWGADLIVVGRRGCSGLSELLLGSVSNYVLHHAPCSVLTIHDRPRASSDAPHEN